MFNLIPILMLLFIAVWAYMQFLKERDKQLAVRRRLDRCKIDLILD